MRKEIARKRLTKTENQIKKLQKKAEDLTPKANPENFFTCVDCGKLHRKSIILNIFCKDLCYDCECKRAEKNKEGDLKQMVLDGKVIEVIVESETRYPDFVALVIQKGGVKYSISARDHQGSLEIIEEVENND